jgi:hypothetical protein
MFATVLIQAVSVTAPVWPHITEVLGNMQDSRSVHRRAKELQEERKRANRRSLPIWVLPVMLFFGWNEMMALLGSPLWLFISILVLLFLAQLYRDLDVDSELEKGLPAFAVSMSRKIVPTSRRLIVNTLDSFRGAVDKMLLDDSQQDGSLRAPARDSVRSEIEMQQLAGSPVEGLRQRAQSNGQGAM